MIHLPDNTDPADATWLQSFTPDHGGRRLPDGAVIDGYMAVISYADPTTGRARWFAHTNMDLPLSQCLGLLELTKLELVARSPGATSYHPHDDD